MCYISTDATLTSANVHSVLASIGDVELRRVLGELSGDSREQMITNYLVKDYSTSWENIAGECFYHEKEKALEEVKKYFKRKLGMLLMIL
jgi:hypothetical protein